jgi:surface antigen
MKHQMASYLIILSIALTGCSSVNNSDVGTISGGLIGGLVGSQFGGGAGRVAAAAGGALAGAYIGDRIGQYMDRQDKMEMQHALETTKTGNATQWTNPDTGKHYTVKPTKTYYRNKRPCREYVTTVYIDGKKQSVRGRACRDKQGNWRVVN